MRSLAALPIILILFFISIPLSPSEAVACQVPTAAYPTVNTALSSGCSYITFINNVVEPAQVNLPPIHPNPIVIDGNGFKWTLDTGSSFKAIFSATVNPLNLRFRDLEIDVLPPDGGPIFVFSGYINVSFDDVEITLDNTMLNGDVMLVITFNAPNLVNTFELRNLNVSGQISNIDLIDMSIRNPMERFLLENVNVKGVNGGIKSSTSLAGEFRNILFDNVYLEGPVALGYDFPFPSGRISINNTLINASNPLYPLGLTLNVRSGLAEVVSIGLTIRGYQVQPLSLYSIGAYTDALFESLTILDEDGNPSTGIMVYNQGSGGFDSWVRLTGRSLYLDETTGIFLDTGVGGSGINVSFDRLYVDGAGVGRGVYLRYNGLDKPTKLIINNSVFTNLEYAVDIYLNRLGTLLFKADNVNSSVSVIDVQALVSRNALDTAEVSIDINRWFVTPNPPPYTAGISAVAAVIGSAPANPVIYGEASYSYIGRFQLFNHVGLNFTESVVDEYSSTIVNSASFIEWTLGVEVRSSIVDVPLPRITTNFYYKSSLNLSTSTDVSGRAENTYGYWFNPLDPKMDDIEVMATSSGYTDSKNLFTDLGVTTTLPSWYQVIILRLPIALFNAFGYVEGLGTAILQVFGYTATLLIYGPSIPSYDPIPASPGQNTLMNLGSPIERIPIKINSLLTTNGLAVFSIKVLYRGLWVDSTLIVDGSERMVWISGPVKFVGWF